MLKYLILFLLALVFSFFLTPLIRAISGKLGAYDFPGERKVHNRPIPRLGGLAIFIAFNLVLLAVVFVAGWSLYGAASYFDWSLPILFKQAFKLDVATKTNIGGPLSGTEAHAAVSLVTVIYSGLFVAIAVLGGLLAWRLRGLVYHDITMLAIVVGCGIAAFAIGSGYGGELYQRIFVFVLPVLAYFGVKLLRLRATAVLLCLFLLIALPLAFISKYGNQTVEHLSTGYLSGTSFFQDSTDNGYIIGQAPFGRMKNAEQYRPEFSYEDLKWQDNKLARFGYGGVVDVAPRYVCISNFDRTWYSYLRNEPQFINEVESSLNVATNCNLVYANPDLSFYIRESAQ